jgi:hypothetical protein
MLAGHVLDRLGGSWRLNDETSSFSLRHSLVHSVSIIQSPLFSLRHSVFAILQSSPFCIIQSISFSLSQSSSDKHQYARVVHTTMCVKGESRRERSVRSK